MEQLMRFGPMVITHFFLKQQAKDGLCKPPFGASAT